MMNGGGGFSPDCGVSCGDRDLSLAFLNLKILSRKDASMTANTTNDVDARTTTTANTTNYHEATYPS
jgi:hypothetical protein